MACCTFLVVRVIHGICVYLLYVSGSKVPPADRKCGVIQPLPQPPEWPFVTEAPLPDITTAADPGIVLKETGDEVDEDGNIIGREQTKFMSNL